VLMINHTTAAAEIRNMDENTYVHPPHIRWG
jgi:hypothetical protein